MSKKFAVLTWSTYTRIFYFSIALVFMYLVLAREDGNEFVDE